VNRIALLANADPAAPFARRGAVTIAAGDFLRDVAALAAVLPDRAHVANLCQDRYRFAVGFAAALCRGQITLLPPSETATVLTSVLSGHDGAYCLTDTDMAVPEPVVAFPLTLPRGAAASVPAFAPDQIAAILYTSGSTGQPLPHPRDWGLLVSSARSAGREIGADRLAGAALIGTVPHQHSYGLESLIMLALQHGLVLHAERPFYPHDILTQLAAAPPPRMLVTTPVHLRALLADPGADPGADSGALPPLDLVLSATAPLTPELACAAEEGFAAPLYEIYGCSEVGQLAFRRTLHTEEWRCLDGITLSQTAAGSFAGGPAITTPMPLADIIELRDPRHFRLLGRNTDIVNIAGKRSSLTALAAQLGGIAGVRDAVFVMADDTGPGQARLLAFAVAPGLTAPAVLAELRGRIDPAFVPRRLVLVQSLPRNALGKITRDTMLALLADKARA
jgi:acyl-coenzyme A synthetase/AMP-(fatty) acid ligase